LYLCGSLKQRILKKHIIPNAIVLFSLILLFFPGCKKDPIPYTPATPPLGLEEFDVKGAMMTLSAISYIDGSATPSVIKDSIKTLLADSSLATEGKWELVWGPGISGGKDNMVYVAMMKSQKVPVYAIVIRGTNTSSFDDILQDVRVLSLRWFHYGEADDSVSKGAMEGFDSLLIAQDEVTGKTLELFLDSLTQYQKSYLFVTGHSQGGGLTPLMAYWLVKHSNFTEKFTINTVAFAGPGVVNKNFRDHFLKALPEDASYHMLVNTLDVVPLVWADLPSINANNIPVYVPHLYRKGIHDADLLFRFLGIKYYNITVPDTIGRIPITETGLDSILPSDTTKWYDHWVGVEHNHNNYLKLLGVKPLKPI